MLLIGNCRCNLVMAVGVASFMHIGNDVLISFGWRLLHQQEAGRRAWEGGMTCLSAAARRERSKKRVWLLCCGGTGEEFESSTAGSAAGIGWY